MHIKTYIQKNDELYDLFVPDTLFNKDRFDFYDFHSIKKIKSLSVNFKKPTSFYT